MNERRAGGEEKKSLIINGVESADTRIIIYIIFINNNGVYDVIRAARFKIYIVSP